MLCVLLSLQCCWVYSRLGLRLRWSGLLGTTPHCLAITSSGSRMDKHWTLNGSCRNPTSNNVWWEIFFFLCPLIIFLVFTHCLLFILFQFHLDFVLWTFVFASVLLISFQSSHLTVYLWGDFNFTETSQWIHFGFVSVNVLFPISWRTFPAKWLAMQFVQGNVVLHKLSKTQVILYLDSSL